MGRRGGAQVDAEFAFLCFSLPTSRWPGWGGGGVRCLGVEFAFQSFTHWPLDGRPSYARSLIPTPSETVDQTFPPWWDGEGRLLYCVSWTCLVAPVGLAGWVKNNVNLNMTIWPPLFWRTLTLAQALTHPHVQAWHMGRDCSYCRASELTDSQVSGFIYSWFVENTETTKAL